MTPSETEKEEFLIENTYPVSSKDLWEALSRRAWFSPGIIVPATLAVLLISYGSTYAAVTSQYNVVITVILLGGLFFYWFVNRFYVVRLNVKQNSVEAGNGGRTAILLPDSFLAGEKNSQNQEFSGGLHRCRQNGDFQK